MASQTKRWFLGLPLAAKVVLAVLVLALLLTVLSPLAAVAAALAFGVSLIALVIRVAQRRSVKGWGIAAVASLVLALALTGVSDALYSGQTGLGLLNSGPGSSETSDAVDTPVKTTYDETTANEIPAGYGDDLPDLQREIEAYLGDRLLDVDVEEYVPGEGYYLVSVNFLYEGSSIEDAHYGILRDVAYVYYLIYASEHGPYVSDAMVTASESQGKAVYVTEMLPEQGAYMEETRGDPQFTRGYYKVLYKDPALPY